MSFLTNTGDFYGLIFVCFNPFLSVTLYFSYSFLSHYNTTLYTCSRAHCGLLDETLDDVIFEMAKAMGRANFFFGRTFDLVSGKSINYACAVTNDTPIMCTVLLVVCVCV